MADLRLWLVSLLFTVTNVHVSSQQYNSGFTKAYYISDVLATWSEAEYLCEMEGMSLATVRNAEEQGLLRSALKNGQATLLDCYWIAAKNVGCNNGEYCWFGERTDPVTWSNWGTSILVNILNFFRTDKCVKVWKEEAKWYERDCSAMCYFACELYDGPTSG